MKQWIQWEKYKERGTETEEKKIYMAKWFFFSLMFRALFVCKFHILHVISYSI